MSEAHLPADLSGVAVHMVGIKGTGMSALAEILVHRDARVTGSDTDEVFYTDAILRSLGVPFAEEFSAANVSPNTEVVVYSAAYDPETHPELVAAQQRGIPVLVYTDALASLSAHSFAVAIAGVHGKTTTTAMIGSIVRNLGLPGTVLVGSAVRDFGNRSTLVQGDEFFCAETCEYRRHFLAFDPDVAVITNVEADHLDYFRDLSDVQRAFDQFADRLPDGGALIYCADDPGATRVAVGMQERRPGVATIPYGETADGPFGITRYVAGGGVAEVNLASFEKPFRLALPGAHIGLNAAAALAVIGATISRGGSLGEESAAAALRDADGAKIREALSEFGGLSRRSELLGRAKGILFLDDYAHHPTAIRKTLRALRDFYEPQRLIVDFMSHTFTRTEALLSDFAVAFTDADEVIVHRIYPSAREAYSGSIRDSDLADAISEHHPSVRYFPEVMDAAPYLADHLEPGDLFVTMGAGSNWQLSHSLLKELS